MAKKKTAPESIRTVKPVKSAKKSGTPRKSGTTGKRGASGDQELRAAVARLQARLDKAEAQASRWRAKAKEQSARAQKLEKKLSKSGGAKVRRAVEKAKDTAAEAISVTATAIDPSDSTAPNASWTVTRLRAEARTRGVANYSRKSKEQLLADLA